MITEFVVTAGETRKRLDVFLRHREPDISRSGLQRLIEHGRIRVNAQVVKPSQKIKPGDSITMDAPQPGPLALRGEKVPLEVLYEDEVLLVVNKPAGIVVHPTSGYWSGTLVNALLSHFQNAEGTSSTMGRKTRPGLVHRLDKDTSGVMVIAKTDPVHRALAAQFEQHTITRAYEALIWGVPQHDHGVIDLAIGRDTDDPKTCSSNTARPQDAVTEYRVEHRIGTIASQVVLYPRTGRTHQLRVHMTSLGCPILGDQTYGGGKVCRVEGITIPRMMLHARSLGFQHPSLGTFQEYTACTPSDVQAVYRALQWETAKRQKVSDSEDS